MDAEIADLNWGKLLKNIHKPLLEAHSTLKPLDSIKALLTRLTNENPKFAAYLKSAMVNCYRSAISMMPF